MKLVECVYVYVVIKVYQYSKNKLDFYVRGNPDGEGFHWLFTSGKQPHRQTGQFMVWINGKQKSGLVNFIPESRLPFVHVCTN